MRAIQEPEDGANSRLHEKPTSCKVSRHYSKEGGSTVGFLLIG